MRLITPMACSARARTRERLRIDGALHLAEVFVASPTALGQVVRRTARAAR